MANNGVQLPNLDHIKSVWPLLGESLDEVTNLFNNLGQKLSTNPQGKTLAPPPHANFTMVAANGVVHFNVDNGNNPRTRQLHNFVEWDTDPGFSNAQVEHLYASPQRRIATMLGQPIYGRSYTMYADGEQQSPYRYASVANDGLATQTYLQATGTPPAGTVSVATTLGGPPLPKSTGSGTSPTPGRGFGIEKFVPDANTPGKPPKVFK